MITVAADGKGDFRTVQAAVDAVPDESTDKTRIYIKNGIYREKVAITKSNISLIGESAELTVLTHGDYAAMTDASGEPINTFWTYTLFAGGNDFTAENLTIENSAGPGSRVGQAIAAYVDGDRAVFRNCRLLGHQDTLFTGPLPPYPLAVKKFGGPREGQPRRSSRQYYENCRIKGEVDFIFGSAAAVFRRCEIVSDDPGADACGWITAASTPEGQAFGYVFMECRLTGEALPRSVYLGRPWRNFAKTVFIRCHMGEHIREEGWDNWQKPECEQTVLYAEYGCTGPGSTPGSRVGWSKKFTAEEAEQYSVENVLRGEDGWKIKLI
jgi:pectinesterase